MQLTLTRDTPHTDLWLGVIECAGRKFQALESSDCLPAGVYRLRQHVTPSGEQCFALVSPPLGVYQHPFEVPPARKATARSRALIRAGEYFWDAHGGIVLGKSRVLDTVRAFDSNVRTWKMTETKSAMNELRTLIGIKFDIELTIVGSMEAQAAS